MSIRGRIVVALTMVVVVVVAGVGHAHRQGAFRIGGPTSKYTVHMDALSIPLNQCRNDKNLNTYQMDTCTGEELLIARNKLNLALAKEARNFGGGSATVGHQLVSTAQSAFLSYMRGECLAEASVDIGGTIYPIVFGGCELTLLDQRLRLVQQEIAAFARL